VDKAPMKSGYVENTHLLKRPDDYSPFTKHPRQFGVPMAVIAVNFVACLVVYPAKVYILQQVCNATPNQL
jgi:hypothetical protein